MYKIIEANFLKSSSKIEECPPPEKGEVAFIGRSNVGKSSLINMLTGRKSLAKISGKPGKTRLINHFEIDGSWYLVDLPGYGWAKVSKTEQSKWEGMVHTYLETRKNLRMIFVLIDSRHEPQKSDLQMVNWLGENHIPVGLVFTKTDKSGNNLTFNNVKKFKKELGKFWEEFPPIFLTSSVTDKGKEELLKYIVDTCL